MLKWEIRILGRSYSLYSIIIHTGRNAVEGHYICYIKTEEGWFLLNDEVAEKTGKPPVNQAYILLKKSNKDQKYKFNYF